MSGTPKLLIINSRVRIPVYLVNKLCIGPKIIRCILPIIEVYDLLWKYTICLSAHYLFILIFKFWKLYSLIFIEENKMFSQQTKSVSEVTYSNVFEFPKHWGIKYVFISQKGGHKENIYDKGKYNVDRLAIFVSCTF